MNAKLNAHSLKASLKRSLGLGKSARPSEPAPAESQNRMQQGGTALPGPYPANGQRRGSLSMPPRGAAPQMARPGMAQGGHIQDFLGQGQALARPQSAPPQLQHPGYGPQGHVASPPGLSYPQPQLPPPPMRAQTFPQQRADPQQQAFLEQQVSPQQQAVSRPPLRHSQSAPSLRQGPGWQPQTAAPPSQGMGGPAYPPRPTRSAPPTRPPAGEPVYLDLAQRPHAEAMPMMAEAQGPVHSHAGLLFTGSAPVPHAMARAASMNLLGGGWEPPPFRGRPEAPANTPARPAPQAMSSSAAPVNRPARQAAEMPRYDAEFPFFAQQKTAAPVGPPPQRMMTRRQSAPDLRAPQGRTRINPETGLREAWVPASKELDEEKYKSDKARAIDLRTQLTGQYSPHLDVTNPFDARCLEAALMNLPLNVEGVDKAFLPAHLRR